MTNLWSKKTCLLITGASRGIGRTIAIEFSKRLAHDSLIILTARNSKGLEDTKNLMQSNHIKVVTRSIDLEKSTENELSDMVSIDNTQDYEQAIIIHNAGSLGDLSKWSAELDNLKELQDYFNMNFFSMILSNNLFLKQFPNAKRIVINITSLWAIQPSQNFVLYCCGKAAREMYVKVLAKENPDVRVLSYSPGPVTTDMADDLYKGLRCPEIKALFTELRSNGSYLSTEQTVEKLITILETDKYISGQHVDYFDTA